MSPPDGRGALSIAMAGGLEHASGHRLVPRWCARRGARAGTRMTGPEARPASADRVTITRRIAAPAHAIFLLVSDPARHVDIDGSGMLRAAPGARALTAVGQTFDIDMDRRPLGEVPNTEALHQLVMTAPDYLVRCTVTKLIPDRLIEWAVRAVGKPPAGHVYGWQIEPITDSESLVSHYCDWAGITDELRAKFRWPVVPADRLENSVENLDRLATRSGRS